MSILKISRKIRQLGQGMSEYLIVVALIAVVGVSVVGFLGGAINSQLSGVAQKIAGGDATTAKTNATTAGNEAVNSATTKNLSNFTDP